MQLIERGELATLLTGKYINTSILPLQFSEYYDFMLSNPPNLSKSESLAVYTIEGGIPEYFNQKSIIQNQADGFIRSVLNTIIEKDIFAWLQINALINFTLTD